MAESGVETSRVSDGDRDSKSLWEAIGDLNRKVAGAALSVHRTIREFKQGLESLKQDRHRTGRELTRTPVEKMEGPYLHWKFQKEHTNRFEQGKERLKSTSPVMEDSGTEIECWFHEYMEKEACFLGFYQANNAAESVVVRFKRNLPVFDGFWHIEDLLTWIDAIEDFFEEVSPPENLKCKIVWYKMKGAAYYWWKILQNDRLSEGKNLIISWPRMKTMLLNRFSPTKCLIKLPTELNSNKDDEKNNGDPLDAYGSNHGELNEQNMSERLSHVTVVQEIIAPMEAECVMKQFTEKKGCIHENELGIGELSSQKHLAAHVLSYSESNMGEKKYIGKLIEDEAETEDLADIMLNDLKKCAIEGQKGGPVHEAANAIKAFRIVPNLDRQSSGDPLTRVPPVNLSTLKIMILEPLFHGLVEKFSSKVIKFGSETRGVAKDDSAKEERSRRQLLYESDFMNGDTHCMSFDPGGIFYPLDHFVCLVSLDPRFCVSFLIDLRVLPHVITLQISMASNEHSYMILAYEKAGNGHIECIYVDSLWQKRSPKIINAIDHGPFTTPGVCVLLDLRCTICMGAPGYGELRTMYNTIVLGVVKVIVKLSVLYCSSWKHVKVHFAESEHLLFRWGNIPEINVDAENIIMLMLPLLYCSKKRCWTAKQHYLSMAIFKPHHTYFALITSPAMAVELRNSMLSKGAAPDLSVCDHLVFSWTKESVANENFSLNDKWKEKLRPSSSAGVATSLTHWCFLRGKEESMEGCVETIDERTAINMELKFLGSRIEALESYLHQTEEANGDSILQKIRQKDVRFLGAYTSPSNQYIGSEFMPNVYDFLHKQKVSFKLIALFKVVVEIASHAFPSRYIEYLFFIDSKWYRWWLDEEMNYLGYMINMAALHTLAPAWEFYANKQIGSKEIWTSGESYICVINGLPDYNFQVAHGRVILREEWNGENNAYMERELIMVEISVIIDSSYVNILSKNEKSRKSLKLFHMVVNGLDPPKNIDGACESSILDAYEFDRLGPMNLLATYHISWNFYVADLSLYQAPDDAPTEDKQLEDEFIIFGER